MIDYHLPFISAAQMKMALEHLESRFHVTKRVSMELASRAVSRWMLARCSEPNSRVLVLVGPGGTGTVALMVARTLSYWGVPVVLSFLRPPDKCTPLSRELAEELSTAGLPTYDLEALKRRETLFTVVVDGLLGVGMNASPSPECADLIHFVNGLHADKVALEVPSGIHATTGMTRAPVFHSDYTLSFGLPKRGLVRPLVRRRVGHTLICDIGAPSFLYGHHRIGVQVPIDLFQRHSMIPLS